MPVLALLPFIDRNFDEKFAVLRGGKRYEENGGYMTVKMALDDGAVVLSYGYVCGFWLVVYLSVWLSGYLIVSYVHACNRARECVRESVRGDDDDWLVQLILSLTRHFRTFINKVFNFLGIGISLYIIANVYTWVSNDAVIKNTVKCKFCRKRISEKVCLCFVFLILLSKGGGS